MALTVFFSWQSDVKGSRSFLLEVLEKAAKELRAENVGVIEVDRDTQGLPGAVEIKSAILDKIEKAHAFVADVTIINSDASEPNRLTPNPNVLIELGYALKCLGHSRLVLVMNKAFGKPEMLPFDLRGHLVLGYSLKEGDDKAAERKRLVRGLKEALETILQHPARRPERERLERVVRFIRSKQAFHGMVNLNFELTVIGSRPALKIEKWYELNGQKRPAAGSSAIASGQTGAFLFRFNFPDPGQTSVHAKLVLEYENDVGEKHRCEMEARWVAREPSLTDPKFFVEGETGWIEV